MTKIHSTSFRLAGLTSGLALLLTAPAWADNSYSFPRVLEGPASIVAASGDRENLEEHMPLLVGDRIWVPYDSRMEVVLSDRSLLRIAGDAELDLARVAYSSDTDDRTTELYLNKGEIQLIVPEDVLGDALPVIVTPDATIYVHDPGTFRITVSRKGWTELVVREGRAEISSARNASLVYPGDMAVAESGSRPYFEIRRAGYHDNLERWGDELAREASYASVPHVDPSLAYVAAPLGRHGAWVSIGGSYGWRPRVAVTWRPYSHGYWRNTPGGLTWVSRDPWGYVTHHYGSWDYVPGYGWVWYPGSVYRRAWVHWYWGPDYVGWCPSGYYASYYGGHGYGHRGSGLSFGIYGWAGGSWSHFEHWSFTASIDFGKRDHHHVYSGKAMAERVSTRALQKGIITTDPGARGHKNAAEVLARLENEARDYRRTSGRELPDVSDFVARRRITEDLREAILKPKPLRRSERETAVVKPGGARRDPRTLSSGRTPVTKPYRLERSDDERGRVRVSPRDDKPARDVPTYRRPTTDRPTYDRPTVKPRSEDERPTIERPRYERPTVKPRSEDGRPTIERPRYERPTVKPRTEDKETPRVSSPSRERSSSRERPSVSPGGSSSSKPSVSSAKPSSKPSAKSSERGKGATEKSSKTSSKLRKRKKDN